MQYMKSANIYCVDGPLNGQVVNADFSLKKIEVPLTSNHFYKSAVYLVSGKFTALGEYIAIFSHCKKR